MIQHLVLSIFLYSKIITLVGARGLALLRDCFIRLWRTPSVPQIHPAICALVQILEMSPALWLFYNQGILLNGAQ